ncbi:MAG: hypothetical protein LC624_07115 [Halobacteriales archaeon]|nr:hypothetical protein [Halobacteriales archaeon]
MAAHRMRRGQRLLEVQAAEGPLEGYRTISLEEGGATGAMVHDGPPEGYTGRWAQEHGELRVAPAVDALLARMRKLRSG